jgi:hypothetical protein
MVTERNDPDQRVSGPDLEGRRRQEASYGSEGEFFSPAQIPASAAANAPARILASER